jgi:hypothetical protein
LLVSNNGQSRYRVIRNCNQPQALNTDKDLPVTEHFTDITCGAGTADHSGTPELTPISSGVGVARSLVFYVLTVCFVDPGIVLYETAINLKR